MQELFIILHGEFPILTDDFLVMFSINQSCRMESPQSNPSFLKNAAHHSLLPGAALAPPSALLPPRKATPPRAVWGNNNCSHPFLSSSCGNLLVASCVYTARALPKKWKCLSCWQNDTSMMPMGWFFKNPHQGKKYHGDSNFASMSSCKNTLKKNKPPGPCSMIRFFSLFILY